MRYEIRFAPAAALRVLLSAKREHYHDNPNHAGSLDQPAPASSHYPKQMKPFNRSILEPGDCLLYRPSGIFGRIIAIKTWTKISHCECYTGSGVSVASRDGIGVNRYVLRTDGLAFVLRPNRPFSLVAAEEWFRDVRGQKYDWKGLLCFTLAVRQGAPDRMFCSEFLTRWYRAGGFECFGRRLDADHVAPAQFLQSPLFDEIWSDEIDQPTITGPTHE